MLFDWNNNRSRFWFWKTSEKADKTENHFGLSESVFFSSLSLFSSSTTSSFRVTASHNTPLDEKNSMAKSLNKYYWDNGP